VPVRGGFAPSGPAGAGPFTPRIFGPGEWPGIAIGDPSDKEQAPRVACGRSKLDIPGGCRVLLCCGMAADEFNAIGDERDELAVDVEPGMDPVGLYASGGSLAHGRMGDEYQRSLRMAFGISPASPSPG
jgi:hypothetical protein